MFVKINLVGRNMAIVEADCISDADKFARWEFGNRNFESVQEATEEELDWYKALNGIIYQAKKENLNND